MHNENLSSMDLEIIHQLIESYPVTNVEAYDLYMLAHKNHTLVRASLDVARHMGSNCFTGAKYTLGHSLKREFLAGLTQAADNLQEAGSEVGPVFRRLGIGVARFKELAELAEDEMR